MMLAFILHLNYEEAQFMNIPPLISLFTLEIHETFKLKKHPLKMIKV